MIFFVHLRVLCGESFSRATLVSLVTLATVWRVPAIARYRWDETKYDGTDEKLVRREQTVT